MSRSVPCGLLASLLVLAASGCSTTIAREDVALRPPALRGVQPGDAVDEELSAFATRKMEPWHYFIPTLLPFALAERPPEPVASVNAPAFFEGVDFTGDPLREVKAADFGYVLVLAPAVDGARRLAAVWIQGFESPETGEPDLKTVPVDELGLGPLELGGATKDCVVWRTSAPGVFVADDRGGSALLLGPADLLERGTFPSLLPADAPEVQVHRGWPEALAAAGREGWPFARIRPVLEGVLAMGESTTSGRFARPAAWELLRGPVPTLIEARAAAWTDELAALPAPELLALAPLLRDLDPGNQRGLLHGAAVAHFERRAKAGQRYAAAGSVDRLFGCYRWGHERPDTRALLAGAALLPPVEVTGGGDVLGRTLGWKLPDLVLRADAAGVRVQVDEEESVTVVDAPGGEERRTKDNPAHAEWLARGAQLERDAVTQKEIAGANEHYQITEWQHRNVRRKTTYVGVDGNELGTSSELVGREEFLVVVGENSEMRRRHEGALAALERNEQERAEHARSEPPRELSYTVPMTVQTFGGAARWRVTVTGPVELQLEAQREATAVLGWTHRVESPLSRLQLLDRVRQAMADELAATLIPALGKAGEAARARYLAAFTDATAREEEAAWLRRLRGEPAAAGDERFTGLR